MALPEPTPQAIAAYDQGKAAINEGLEMVKDGIENISLSSYQGIINLKETNPSAWAEIEAVQEEITASQERLLMLLRVHCGIDILPE